MEIRLTPAESEQMFHTALCNGLSYFNGYGLELSFDKQDYKTAKGNCLKQNPDSSVCYEDVLLQILRDGKTLKVIDHECEGEYNREITLADVHERVQKTDRKWILQMVDEEDDAETADCIIQTVFFEEIVFG